MKIIEFRLRIKTDADEDELDDWADGFADTAGTHDVLPDKGEESLGCTWIEVEGEEDKYHKDLPDDMQ